ALPLTPPSFLRQRLHCRLFTWTCGAQPAFVARVTSVTFCWWLTTTRVTPQSSPCAARARLSCSASALRQRRGVFLCPSGSLLSCTGNPPDLHASGLSTAKWDCLAPHWHGHGRRS
ncbi:unnamed protein product, partial [Closterium sp. NIES-53]